MLQKTDPKLESNNYLRIENDSYFVSVFDLSTDKSLKTLNEKLSNVKEIEQQLTNLTAKLKLVYDFEPSVKKLYLVVIYQDFYLNNYHEMTTIISKSKHLNVININEVVARNEDLCKAINENNSIKKAVFELHDDNLIFKVLDNLKLNNNIQTLCMKDLKLSGDSLKEIFSSFFSSNTSLTSLNLIKNKIDQNVNGIEVLNGLLVNSKTPLKKLNLTNNVIKSENFAKNLGEILKNKELTKLKLGRCQLNNLEIFSNLYNYIHPSKLQILDLSFNYIDLNLISDFIVNNLNINKLILFQSFKLPRINKSILVFRTFFIFIFIYDNINPVIGCSTHFDMISFFNDGTLRISYLEYGWKRVKNKINDRNSIYNYDIMAFLHPYLPSWTFSTRSKSRRPPARASIAQSTTHSMHPDWIYVEHPAITDSAVPLLWKFVAGNIFQRPPPVGSKELLEWGASPEDRFGDMISFQQWKIVGVECTHISVGGFPSSCYDMVLIHSSMGDRHSENT